MKQTRGPPSPREVHSPLGGVNAPNRSLTAGKLGKMCNDTSDPAGGWFSVQDIGGRVANTIYFFYRSLLVEPFSLFLFAWRWNNLWYGRVRFGLQTHPHRPPPTHGTHSLADPRPDPHARAARLPRHYRGDHPRSPAQEASPPEGIRLDARRHAQRESNPHIPIPRLTRAVRISLQDRAASFSCRPSRCPPRCCGTSSSSSTPSAAPSSSSARTRMRSITLGTTRSARRSSGWTCSTRPVRSGRASSASGTARRSTSAASAWRTAWATSCARSPTPTSASATA